MGIIPFDNFAALSIENPSDYLDGTLYHIVAREGFKNTSWEAVPDHILMYIFLHDEPTLGKKRSSKTKIEYYRDISKLLDFSVPFGGLRNLSPEDLLAFQYEMEKEYAPTTQRRRSVVMKQFLRFLYKNGALEADLSFKMKKVSQPKELLVNRDLYEDEVRQLLDYFRSHDWFAFTLMHVLVSTGLRIEELADAMWRKLFYYRKLNRYFLRVMGKGGKERDVLIFEDVLESIREFRLRKGFDIELHPGCETAFFPKGDGSHYSEKYLSTEFSRLIKKTLFPFVVYREDPITPHTCRHYTAAYLTDKGIDLRAIQEMLGHASIVTTEGYLWKKRRLENHAGLKLDNRFI